jgi:hypothetical protein
MLSVSGAGNSLASSISTTTISSSRSITTAPQKAYQETTAAPVASDLKIEEGTATALPVAVATKEQRGPGSAELTETNLPVRALSSSSSSHTRWNDLLNSLWLSLSAADDLSIEDPWQARLRSKLTKLPAVLSVPSNYRQHPKGSL